MSSSQQLLLGEGAGGAAPVYIEDVFSTYLYTGTGSALSIVNNIDLAGDGGLVWIKTRTISYNHTLVDTQTGAQKRIASDTADPQTAYTAGVTSFNSDGFSLGTGTLVNSSGPNRVSWTFRKQPKFFDVVTYTGNGSARTIAHNLGSAPGCMIVKCTSDVTDWAVYHRSLTSAANGLQLNGTSAQLSVPAYWNSTAPTSTVFSVGADNDTNGSGRTYVAYLFAHNAGGFGLSGSDNVISCGSFTTDGSGSATVNLGYEPQYLLFKATNVTQDWFVLDTMRGFSYGDSCPLYPNLDSVEGSFSVDAALPTATGFVFNGSLSLSKTWIYIAIRRGPMKVPTTGTSVFQPVTYTGTNVDNRLVDTGIVTDAIIARQRAAVVDTIISNRLQADYMNFTNLTDDNKSYADGLDTAPDGKGTSFSSMTGFYVGNSASTNLNQASTAQLAYAFRRAPSFMDVVMYTGTGANRTVSHNLAAVPELMLVKRRSTADAWAVYFGDPTDYLRLNDTQAAVDEISRWNDTAPTSTVFTVGTDTEVNTSGQTYVNYLFATCAGVSKVGSYTGTGTTLQINCGFTAGARFVLIKRTDSTGGWYYWDTARGIVAGNDPYLFLNSSNAEVTNTDYVDTYSAGFEISSTAPAAINASGGTFIFLAIA